MIATFLGWALDGMDLMIFTFALPALISLWHITKSQAGLLMTSTLIISAAGGWLAGILADRWGRVRMLQITILWFAVFTLLSGLTFNFAQLLIARGLEGLGFGGEWAVGSVLIGETIRSRHRGKAVGTMQGGWAIGWGVAAAAYAALFSVFPPQLAWRIMFGIGILPALLVFYIQSRLREPEIFQAHSATKNKAGRTMEIFGRGWLRITFFTTLVSLGAQGGYYAITTFLPLFLKESRGLSVLNTGGYLAVVITGSFVGYMVSAYLADWLGRKGTLVLFAALSLVTAVLYTSLELGNAVMLVLGFPLGFFASGIFSPIGAFFTELFPTRIRGSGQGFSYNAGRGIGALFPLLIGYLSSRLSLGHAIAYFSGIAYAIMIVGVLALPETKGRQLPD